MSSRWTMQLNATRPNSTRPVLDPNHVQLSGLYFSGSLISLHKVLGILLHFRIKKTLLIKIRAPIIVLYNAHIVVYGSSGGGIRVALKKWIWRQLVAKRWIQTVRRLTDTDREGTSIVRAERSHLAPPSAADRNHMNSRNNMDQTGICLYCHNTIFFLPSFYLHFVCGFIINI